MVRKWKALVSGVAWERTHRGHGPWMQLSAHVRAWPPGWKGPSQAGRLPPSPPALTSLPRRPCWTMGGPGPMLSWEASWEAWPWQRDPHHHCPQNPETPGAILAPARPTPSRCARGHCPLNLSQRLPWETDPCSPALAPLSPVWRLCGPLTPKYYGPGQRVASLRPSLQLLSDCGVAGRGRKAEMGRGGHQAGPSEH